jgi:hypothetical protein
MDYEHGEASDSSDDRSDSLVEQRPNRYKGHPSTWRGLTQQERSIAFSLDQQRNEDLAMHLYNAHALKQRAQDPKKLTTANPWSSKVLGTLPLRFRLLTCDRNHGSTAQTV